MGQNFAPWWTVLSVSRVADLDDLEIWDFLSWFYLVEILNQSNAGMG